MTSLVLNQELNGVELYFDNKPIKAILETLKSNGFRWSNYKKCWYAKQNEKSLKLAEKMTKEEITTDNITEVTETKQTIKKDSRSNLSLWDRIQFEEGKEDISKYKYNFVGSNYTGLSTKETAKIIRQHLKSRFPEVKFSVTSDYNKIDITIKSSPYENLENKFDCYSQRLEFDQFKKENNREIKSILDYCQKLLDSYNFDNSDTMTDYFHCHYYDHVGINYKYIQTEQTEAIKEDITAFRNKLNEEAKAEEERKELEYQEYLKQEEEDKKESEIRANKIKEEKEIINNSINVKELEGNNQYFIIGSQFAHLNKNNTLEEYKEEVKKGEFSLQNVKVTKEVHFNSEESLNYFSNLLMHGFDFLEGTGGSFTDDNRINTMTDFYNLDKEERETIKWITLGVAVYCNNELQFIVDASGHSYARYVGLVDNITIQKDCITEQIIKGEELEELKNKAETLTDISVEVITENNLVKTWNSENWNEYKEFMKEKLKSNNFRLSKEIIQQLEEDQETLKVAMYKLLVEVDGIQEQFKKAELQQGQKLTLIYMSDFGSIVTSKIIFDKFENSTYAQYDKAVKLTFKPENKRKLYYSYFYRDMLIYNGWLDLPEEVLYTVRQTGTGITITSTKFLSCDNKQYDAIIEHFAADNIKPIINTYKPIF